MLLPEDCPAVVADKKRRARRQRARLDALHTSSDSDAPWKHNHKKLLGTQF